MRSALKIAGALAGVYVAFWLVVLVLAYRSPGGMARVIARIPGSETPGPVLMPLQAIMFAARSGPLRAGMEAPDFELKTADHRESVRLSSFCGKRPVVLVFGSYT
ncbi:MAG: hypothetical protein M3Z09_03085 [Acidobacteriota bacterium]|nr:hypothetical protein [Acidobacteriota bacterium]